jgi:hypothetical protein
MYSRNVHPGCESLSEFPGYTGAFYSYYSTRDGPSKGSGYEVQPNDLFDGSSTDRPIIFSGAYTEGVSSQYFNQKLNWNDPVNREKSNSTMFTDPWHLDVYDATTWYFNIATWDSATGTFEHVSIIPAGSDVYGNKEDIIVSQKKTLEAKHIGLTLPEGFFVFGRGDLTDPTLNSQLDDLCMFKKVLSRAEMLQAAKDGCEAVPGGALELHYTFDDDDKAASTDIKNSVAGKPGGISTTSIRNDGQEFIIDFGTDAGPVKIVSDLKVPRGRPVFTRPKSAGEIPLAIECVGTCDHLTIKSLPDAAKGFLCASTIACTAGTKMAVSSIVAVQNGVGTVYYKPAGISVAGSEDSFQVTAYDKADESGSFSDGVVTVLTNTAPTTDSAPVDVTEAESTIKFLSADDVDGKLHSLSLRVTHLYGRSDVVNIYDCAACYQEYADKPDEFKEETSIEDYIVKTGKKIEKKNLPFTITDPLRRLVITHIGTEMQDTGDGLLSFTVDVFDGLEYSSPFNYTVNVISVNAVPDAKSSQSLKLSEDADIQTYTLAASDREGDNIVYEINRFPEGMDLFQYSDDTTDESTLVKMDDSSGAARTSQWVSYNLLGHRKSVWDELHDIDQVAGPPNLYPLGVDGPNVWGNSYDDDYTKQWIDVYWDTPVYPESVVVYHTWGPGSIMRILAEKYDGIYKNATDLGQDVDWDVIYTGPNTMYQYCPDLPKGNPCAAKLEYALCPKWYKTNHLRFEMEADDPARYFSIDSILLTGKEAAKKSLVLDPTGRILIKPQENYNGETSFGLQVSDCPYFLSLQELAGPDSRRSTIDVKVDAVNDLPSLTWTGDAKSFEILDPLDAVENGVPIEGLDCTDAENQAVRIAIDSGGSMAAFKLLNIVSGKSVNIELKEDFAYNSTIHQVVMFPSRCSSGVKETTSVEFSATDGVAGAKRSQLKLSVDILCDKLPYRYEIVSNDVQLGVNLAVAGGVVVLICLVIITVFSRHRVIRLSSCSFNLLTLLGASLLLASIPFFAADTGSYKECSSILSGNNATAVFDEIEAYSDALQLALESQKKGEANAVMPAVPESIKKCTTTIGTMNCVPRIGLFTFGFALAIGSLASKAYYTNRSIASRKYTKITVAQLMTLLVSVVVAYSVFIGVWFAGYPLSGQLTVAAGPFDESTQNRVRNINAQCTSSQFETFDLILKVSFFLLTLFGAYKSNGNSKAQEIGISLKNVYDFKEVKFGLMNTIVFGAAIFAVVSFSTDAATSYLMTICGVFIGVVVLLLILFGFKIKEIISTREDPKMYVSEVEKAATTPSHEKQLHTGAVVSRRGSDSPGFPSRRSSDSPAVPGRRLSNADDTKVISVMGPDQVRIQQLKMQVADVQRELAKYQGSSQYGKKI